MYIQSVVAHRLNKIQHMPSFSTEILLQIFSLLSQPTLFKVIQVSKHWNSISIPLLWRKPRFKEPFLLHRASLFETYGPFIRDVELQSCNWECTRSLEDDLRLVIDTCTNLTSLELRAVNITTQETAMLCKHLSKQLENLSFSLCRDVVFMKISIWW
jgi:F-box-like